MWTEEDFLARVLPLQGLWGTAVGRLLATAAATLCPLFSKILGITVHVRGGLGWPPKPWEASMKVNTQEIPQAPGKSLGFTLSPHQNTILPADLSDPSFMAMIL